jgi:hypothetical protein
LVRVLPVNRGKNVENIDIMASLSIMAYELDRFKMSTTMINQFDSHCFYCSTLLCLTINPKNWILQGLFINVFRCFTSILTERLEKTHSGLNDAETMEEDNAAMDVDTMNGDSDR